MAEDSRFSLKIISPERIFYEGEAEMVEFNTTEGQIGVYKRHVPMTVIVSPGVLTITEAESQKKAALHAGFAEILGDSVTIMAEIIEWSDEIDLDRAEHAMKRAQERLDSHSPEVDVLRAEIALRKAVVRIGTRS